MTRADLRGANLSMRRRTLLTATVAAGPAALLMGLDEALADRVRARPAIRSIVHELAERHPRASGVRELHAAVATAG